MNGISILLLILLVSCFIIVNMKEMKHIRKMISEHLQMLYGGEVTSITFAADGNVFLFFGDGRTKVLTDEEIEKEE